MSKRFNQNNQPTETNQPKSEEQSKPTTEVESSTLVSHTINGATMRHILTVPRNVDGQDRWTRNAHQSQGSIRIHLNGRYVEIERDAVNAEDGNEPESFNQTPIKAPDSMIVGRKRVARIDCATIRTTTDIYNLVESIIIGHVGESVAWSDERAESEARSSAKSRKRDLQRDYGQPIISALQFCASSDAMRKVYLSEVDGTTALELQAREARRAGLELFDKLESALSDAARTEALKTVVESIRKVFAEPVESTEAARSREPIALDTLWSLIPESTEAESTEEVETEATETVGA